MTGPADSKLPAALWRGIKYPLVIFDREGTIKETNPAFLEGFNGYSAELSGTNLAEILFANNRAKFAEWLSAILHTGENSPQPLEIERNKRSYRADIFSLNNEPNDDSNSPLAMIFIDITREKRIEQQKADFTSMIVHDLRGPLTAIMGSMELVVSSWKEGPKESYRELLTSGIQESSRMMGLVNELLDISKIESGKFQIVQDRISIDSVIRQAVQSMQNIAEREGIRLESVAGGQLPPVDADQDKLTQVLINLLSNAIKFTPEGGMVTIFAERIAGPAGKAAEEVRITVTDTGKGIASADLPRLFSRYSQADNQEAAKEKKMEGTGLGLYIVKELIEAHKGRLELVSVEGLGTSVVFTLPVPA